MADKPSPFAGLDKALLRPAKQQASPPLPVESAEQATEPNAAMPTSEPTTQPTSRATATPRKQATKPPSNDPRNHDTMVSRYHDDIIAAIRGAVRVVGKEAATYRFSPAEKARVAEIIYAYKRQGIRTSENEISRIALNFVFQDYDENGERSVLARVLEALNR